jgi:hypothetical protein
MIDTNKYEGHSTEYSYEIVSVDDGKEMYATYALLNDAPLEARVQHLTCIARARLSDAPLAMRMLRVDYVTRSVKKND